MAVNLKPATNGKRPRPLAPQTSSFTWGCLRSPLTRNVRPRFRAPRPGFDAGRPCLGAIAALVLCALVLARTPWASLPRPLRDCLSRIEGSRSALPVQGRTPLQVPADAAAPGASASAGELPTCDLDIKASPLAASSACTRLDDVCMDQVRAGAGSGVCWLLAALPPPPQRQYRPCTHYRPRGRPAPQARHYCLPPHHPPGAAPGACMHAGRIVPAPASPLIPNPQPRPPLPCRSLPPQGRVILYDPRHIPKDGSPGPTGMPTLPWSARHSRTKVLYRNTTKDSNYRWPYLTLPRICARPASAAEPRAYLAEPRFSSCTVPVVIYEFNGTGAAAVPRGAGRQGRQGRRERAVCPPACPPRRWVLTHPRLVRRHSQASTLRTL